MTDSSELESSNPQRSSSSAQRYLQQAIGCLQNRDLGQARSYARQASDVADSDWSGLERLGLILLRLGELSRSFAVLLQAKRNGQLHGRGFRALAALFISVVMMSNHAYVLKRWLGLRRFPALIQSSQDVQIFFSFALSEQLCWDLRESNIRVYVQFFLREGISA